MGIDLAETLGKIFTFNFEKTAMHIGDSVGRIVYQAKPGASRSRIYAQYYHTWLFAMTDSFASVISFLWNLGIVINFLHIVGAFQHIDQAQYFGCIFEFQCSIGRCAHG